MESWLETIVANIGGGHYREEMLEGRPHLVVNGAILGEDVIEGNRGPIFYPDDENAAAVPQWDHMPIVLDHPTTGSARTVSYLNASKVGVVLNTAHDTKAKKVRPEFWFDKERTKELAPTVYENILNKRPVETSSGLFMGLDQSAGTFNGKPYTGVARKQRPDHVAVLPNKVGAYSVAMGGGIFANSAPDVDTETRTILARTLAHRLNGVNQGESLVVNELSFDQVSCRLAKALASTYGEKGRYWDGWIEAVFSAYVVFYDGKGKTWKQEYTASDSGVTLSGKAVEVVRTVEYEPVDGAEDDNEDAVSNSSRESQTVDKTQIITDLVTNQGYAETDKVWMNKLEPAELKLLPSKKPAPQVNNAATPPAGGTLTLAQLVANSSPSDQAMYADMQATYNAEKVKLVDKISKAPGNRFRPEDLATFPVQNLRMIADLIPDAPVNNAAFNPIGGLGSVLTPITPAQLGFMGAPAPSPQQVNNAGVNNGAPTVPVLGLPGPIDFSAK